MLSQALNLILLTAGEVRGLRDSLRDAAASEAGMHSFTALYPCWSHSAGKCDGQPGAGVNSSAAACGWRVTSQLCSHTYSKLGVGCSRVVAISMHRWPICTVGARPTCDRWPVLLLAAPSIGSMSSLHMACFKHLHVPLLYLYVYTLHPCGLRCPAKLMPAGPSVRPHL